MIQHILNLFVLIRPVNCWIALFSVWVGAAVSSDIYFSYKIMIASISAFMITGFGNVMNDYYDIPVDKFNRPGRPLISGKVTIFEAKILAAIFGGVGLALSPFIHKFAFPIALFAVLSLWIYTPILKGKGFAGNIIIAFVASLAFIYGSLAVNVSLNAVILMAFAFFVHFGREIVKDIQDEKADSKAGIKTGVVIYGLAAAAKIAIVIFAALIVLTFLPYFLNIFKIVYLIAVLIGVDLALLYSIFLLSKTKDPPEMRIISILLKVAMPLGLIAVFLGSRGL